MDISLEVLALGQQVAVLKRNRPRPLLNRLDRLFSTSLRHIWPRWSDVLVIVKPETVVGWHRAGFHLYWRWRSRPRGGRPKVGKEVRILIRRMASENLDWGAPNIHWASEGITPRWSAQQSRKEEEPIHTIPGIRQICAETSAASGSIRL